MRSSVETRRIADRVALDDAAVRIYGLRCSDHDYHWCTRSMSLRLKQESDHPRGMGVETRLLFTKNVLNGRIDRNARSAACFRTLMAAADFHPPSVGFVLEYAPSARGDRGRDGGRLLPFGEGVMRTWKGVDGRRVPVR